MNYSTLFRPLLSYIAHVAARDDQCRERPAFDATAVLRDMNGLAADIRLRGRELPRIDEAWFPVTAWVFERLQSCPEISLALRESRPAAESAGREFFERLNVLLSPNPDGRNAPERIALIELYNLCLQLGYRGYYARPGFENSLAEYRRRCREEMEATSHQDRSSPAGASAKPSWVRGAPAPASLWALPVIATVLLYAVYRVLLSSLYSSVTG